MEMLQELVNKFANFDKVESICLSGSRTGLIYDEKSDFDIYIYSSKPIDIDFRQELAKNYTNKAEIGNDFFGDGDEWILPNGLGIDLMYRDMHWLDNEITRVWDNHQASIGYSTAFLYNIKTSKVLFERKGIFANHQKRLESEYPQELIKSIVAKNYTLLKTKLCASFYEQVEKAISRKDFIAVNHRTTAFLTSYFDILFAINKVLHPGEKKLVEFAEKTCLSLPRDFKSDVNEVAIAPAEKKLQAMDKLLNELEPLAAPFL